MVSVAIEELESHIDTWNYSEWPALEGQRSMEFHLIYQGKLPAASQTSTRAREKHDMRKVFHKQLAVLWKTQPFLIQFARGMPQDPKPFPLADRYARCGYRFMPLVSEWFMVACALDILFLRRDGPGSLIKSGGDIDNRLKVLFDALRMPQVCNEVCGDAPAPDEDPFFCLLEDDKLINKVQVETNWLLTPPAPKDHINDVHLIIRVKTIHVASNKYETAFH
jgi:hypothetical protein